VTLQDDIGRQSSVDFSVIRDTTPPTLTLEAVVQSDVLVTWSATDPSPGSGLDTSKCLLKVREDDEGTWQAFSTDCGGDDTYDGQPGHTYTFRLSASDNVSNAASTEVQAVVPYVTKYYYANGQRIAMQKEGVVYYLHSDHLGSTSLTTCGSQDGCDGTPYQGVVARQLYHPYGTVRHAEGTLPTDYTFTGQRDEAGLGLMHYGARFYSPRLGRFVSADSIVPSPLNPQDFNRYTYGRNNPLAYIDADGHFPVLVLVALGVTAASIAFFRTPACAGEGCAPGTSSSSPEYQVKSYATAAETAVEVYFGAELLFGELLAETWQDEDRCQKESAEEVVEEAEEAIERGAKESGGDSDPITKRPSGFRKKTVQDAWDDAADGPTGGKRCPTCGEEVEVPPGEGPRDWDIDHQPPWSQRDLTERTRKEILDEYNRGTRLECPHCNRRRGARPE
jgi:RHS repeat-associated protein